MKVFLLAISFLISQFVFAQNFKSHYDSLRTRALSLNGLEKADAVAEFATLTIRMNLDSSFVQSERAVELYKKVKNDTALFKFYIRFSDALIDDGKFEAALRYALKAKAMRQEAVQTNLFQRKLFMELSEIHFRHFNNSDSALYYDQLSFAISDDSVSKGHTLKNMALVYGAKGDEVKALDHFFRALSLMETTASPRELAGLYNNIGILYEDDGSNEKAEFYYKKAQELYKGMDYARGQFQILNNLGILYDHMGRHEESLQTLYQVIPLLPQLKSKSQPAILNLNIGNTLTHMGRANEAIGYFEKAMVVFKELDDRYGVTLCHRQLGEALFKVGRYKEAEEHEFTALKMATEFGIDYLITEAHHDLFEIFGETRQYEKAFHHQTLYLQLKDSADSRDKASKLGLLEKEYEIAKQENEKRDLEKQNDIQKAQAKVDNVTRIGLTTGLGLVIGLFIVAWVAYSKAKSKNILLAQQKEKIESQSIEIQEAVKAKSMFFANVSHELRTPVTLITGMLELIREKPSSYDHQKMEIALGNSRKLQALVDEVLDLSRLDAAISQLKVKEQSVQPLLRRIVLSFDSLLIKKNIQLDYIDDHLVDVKADLDEDKFEKIINNLMYNAIKFNHEGGWVKVIGKLSDAKDQIIIDVTDSGVGISEKDIPFVFNRFYQSTSNQQRNKGGVGIGLSLVKEFTELHGGQVSVKSSVGHGSAFEIVLPLKNELAKSELAVLEPEEDLPVLSFAMLEKTPVILIAEDNEEMQFYLKEIFGAYVTLVSVVNGKEALQWLSKNTPDLIISDVMMPEMDGYEFLQHLKSSDLLKNIPVVMLTARGSEGDLLRGLALGVDDYIIKPFHAKELKIRVHNLLVNQQMRRQWQAKPMEQEEVIEESLENKKFVADTESFVATRLNDPSLGIGDLADHLAMSERQLYRKCGLLTGMTPAQLIKEIRLKKAYKMLVEHDVIKIADLSSRVGFENSAYFSRQFLERFGKRPAEML